MEIAMDTVSNVLSAVCAISFPQWILLVVVTCVYLWRRMMAPFKQYNNIPQVAPHWFAGNKTYGSKTMRDTILDHYNALEGQRFGIFWDGNTPTIFLRDLDLIKRVQVGDFDHFVDFGFSDLNYQKAVGNVFGIASMRGDPWKKMKRMVTPPFSVPRLKKTVPAINIAADKLVEYLKANEEKEYLDTNDFTRKFFMNAIASVVFGVDINCYGGIESEFEKQGKTLLSLPKFIIIDIFPKFAGFLKIKGINAKAEKFFINTIKQIVRQRRDSKTEVKDVLGNLMNVAEENPDMTEEMMYKTCVQFFTDGYDSAAQAISTLFYQLTIHPEVQERLQTEIDNVFENKEDDEHIIDVEDMNEMPYLEQVLLEGLRLGCIPSTARRCTKAWKIPGEDFIIPEGMKVYIPIAGLHYDPQYWKDPAKFNPDRFSPELKGSIDNATIQPFGAGPRSCLGQNFVRMEIKIMLIQLLRNFSLRPFGDMPEEMVWSVDAFIGASSVKVKLVRRM